ncbi:hypothetical protein LS73_000790 [Helicobacter muridarum]|uniref:Integral membrane protein n=1 Tax=Helicobacter muridarum TaxID=216 RepID=A0A377PTS6_9HELI|nr:hypothetical protein [Helicobacter muridarum]TLE01698.1 hypothetical protein LS73_000790 [Helicobacter muridarum]STQ86338.1 integral membrane protein [Helicobacter muridarum]
MLFYSNNANERGLYTSIFCILLLADVILLFWFVSQTSIYLQEAVGFFSFQDSAITFGKSFSQSFCYKLAIFGVRVFESLGIHPIYNDFGLRAPFILFHICNCILLYSICLSLFRRAKDCLFCVAIFMLVPGISVSALVVSNASVLILLALLIIYFQLVRNCIAYPLFIVASVFDSGGSIMCLALFIYALYYRMSKTIAFAIICFGLNMYLFAPVFGVPKSYFLDTIGFLAIVFTPALFVYYCAYLYFYTFHNPPNLLNLISFIGFVLVLLLSVRQNIKVDSFMPILSVGIPVFVDRMFSELRVRLPQFRLKYFMRASVVAIFLIFGNLVLFGNKLTYYFSNEHNFAYPFYEAKDIAKRLYDMKITNIATYDNLAKRLAFYGINTNPSSPYRLIQMKDGDIRVIYSNNVIAQYGVIKQ